MSTPEENAQKMIENLPEKTGKSLEEWLKVLNGQSLEKHGEIVKYLKAEHGISHGFANLVAKKFLSGDESASDFLTQMFEGKETLIPLYNELKKNINQHCPDTEFSVKKAYVSLRTSKQFGIIQPSTKTRLDLGLNLKDVTPEGQLELAGSFNSMVSHRVKITSSNDIDEKLVEHIITAYDEST